MALHPPKKPLGVSQRPAILAWLLLAAWLCSPVTPARADTLMLLADDSAPYRELQASFQQSRSDRRDDTVIRLVDSATPHRRDWRRIVTIGTRALLEALREHPEAPVLALMIPSQTFRELVDDYRQPDSPPVAGVFLDQPVERQLALARLLLPEMDTIGFLHSPASRIGAQSVREAAARTGLETMDLAVEDEHEIVAAMESLLAVSDALLALPDPQVFNPRTIKPILLTAIRARKPVVGGFSRSYVRAGVMAGVYSTPAQIGRQGAELLDAIDHGLAADTCQYPAYFEVDVNHRVADALGLPVPPESRLRGRLDEREETLP